jgi:ABC-type nitrate/sulfonate/bicarbonate transport system substrate-binding protein
MKSAVSLLVVIFVSVAMPVPSARSAAPLTKVTITSGSASERDGVLYVAQDQGLFRKHGLDLTFVQFVTVRSPWPR